MTKCPRCGKEKAIVDTRFGILPGKKCQARDSKVVIKRGPEFYSQTKQDRITRERDVNAKDILQPFVGKDHKANPEFVKAYPELATQYFTKDELKKL